MRNAKEYLMQYKKANAKLWRMCIKRDEAEMNIASGGINYDGMPHGTQKTSQPERDAIKITDLEKDIEQQKEIAQQLQDEIILTIEKLQDDDQKNILSALYIKSHDQDPGSNIRPTKWRYVEAMTFIGERQGQRIHGKALQEIEKLIPEKEEINNELV